MERGQLNDSDALCRCAHPRSAHEHYRGGSDCSLCDGCRRYRPMRWWWRLLGRVIDG